MKTFSLEEAADFLKLHPEELRRRAKLGKIPAAKIGKRWVFLELDIVEYVRTQYAMHLQALDKRLGKEVELCHLLNVESTGGLILSPQMVSEYDDLLGLKTKPLRKNTTTD
ncbi:MAG TPA: helix-turn-helix domain-containing protein [Methylophilus sp.]|nr:helix-turn-helix domain-containing protein [Methylophilus sp.]